MKLLKNEKGLEKFNIFSKKILTFFLILFTLTLLVSCSKEEVSDYPTHEYADVTEDVNPEAKPTGEVHQVVIENNQFMPTDLEISLGDTVEWVNKDSVDHTATLENGNFDSLLTVGATGSYTFMQKGSFNYFCQFHPGMQGSVSVS